MAAALMMAFQAAALTAPAGAGPAPIDFDLATVRAGAGEDAFRIGCRRGGDSDEIVVCARRRGGDYPMEEMERRYAFKPLVAETGIGRGAIARAYVESAAMPDGQVSKRAMVGIKLPF
jgi:hypothetical protein